MKTTAALVAALMLAFLFACTAQSSGPAAFGDNMKIAAAEARELAKPEPERFETARKIAASANDFAFKLSAALAKEAGSENVLCSPISVWLPLAALANAADDAQGVASALGAQGMTADDINAAASAILYDLTLKADEPTPEEAEEYAQLFGYEYHNPFAIANAVFVGKGAALNPSFVQDYADYYRGAAINVDFASPDAVNAVNSWADESTGGLIPEIIQGFDADTAAAIANAVYFSDRWNWEFDPDKTQEDVFHASGGDVKARFMPREGDMLTYYEDGRVQAMPLSFKTGGGMMIILPKDGDANGLLASMTYDYFQEIREDSIRATGKLLLPRFSMDSGVMDLRPALEELGFSSLFEREAAPLTGLVEGAPVWLSGAVQKARIEVDEKGTTAAAVTVIPAPGMAMPQPTEPFEMRCDRPFVIVLYGRGDTVVFTGVVNRP